MDAFRNMNKSRTLLETRKYNRLNELDIGSNVLKLSVSKTFQKFRRHSRVLKSNTRMNFGTCRNIKDSSTSLETRKNNRLNEFDIGSDVLKL